MNKILCMLFMIIIIFSYKKVNSGYKSKTDILLNH